ncbi:membrane protein [Aliidongia dinghuensis]|uniref:Membrane protein n=1 Tax=Aliidongia dinghuensis TaxID=1867774 RepID=A0A8J2YUU5_9PROT|nr:OmpA family protein [Aliidongia dinghuensis]GGF24412.1 membrane protein [Aliidongia dinghuensis]
MSRAVRLLLPAFLLLLPSAAATAADLEGAKDSPVLGRFAGSEIKSYKQAAYDEAELPNAPITDNSPKLMTVEGKITRIGYTIDGSHSVLEVARNYEQALAAGKFETVFACKGKECGDQFSSVVVNSGRVMPVTFPSSFIDDRQRAYLAKRTGPDGDTWAFVYVMDDTDSNKINNIYLEIVEPKPMNGSQVTVLDAKSLESALDSQGKVALYGIYFDTDKADVKPESKPELGEMAKLLTGNPKLTVYVVGHTDNEGQFAHNLELSQRRADAIVKALTTEYKVPAAQLTAKAVASLAPVASNADEAGRAKNRRVELVVQ